MGETSDVDANEDLEFLEGREDDSRRGSVLAVVATSAEGAVYTTQASVAVAHAIVAEAVHVAAEQGRWRRRRRWRLWGWELCVREISAITVIGTSYANTIDGAIIREHQSID